MGALHRSALVVLALGVVGLVGCVSPDDFRGSQNTCEAPSFDLKTRDNFCSGSWAATPVVQVADIFAGDLSRPAVKVQGRWLTTAQSIGGGDVRVQVFEARPDGTFFNRLTETRRIEAQGEVTSLALMLPDALDFEPEDEGMLALVTSRRELSFVPLNPLSAQVPSWGSSADDLFTGTGMRETLAEGCGNAPQVSVVDGAAPGPGDTGAAERFEFADVEVWDFIASPRAYSFVFTAARCGITVWGHPGQASSTPLPIMELPIPATDIAVDAANNRLLIAAGRAGVRIVDLEALRPMLQERTDLAHRENPGNCERSGEVVSPPLTCDECANCVEGCPPECFDGTCVADPCPEGEECMGEEAVCDVGEPCVGGDTPDPGTGSPCAGCVCLDERCQAQSCAALEPDEDNGYRGAIFDGIEGTTIDPAERAAFNVTSIRVQGDRVAWINEATEEDVDFNDTTWLVSGRIQGGALVSKVSVPLSRDDFDHLDVDWRVVGVSDETYAVLFNAWDKAADGELSRTSFVLLVDAPDGVSPEVVLSLPTTGPVEDIIAIDGALLVVQADLAFRYTFDIQGDPL